jgi:hypothetical protein
MSAHSFREKHRASVSNRIRRISRRQMETNRAAASLVNIAANIFAGALHEFFY